MPSKFSPDQGAKVQEYFVYFKLLQRRASGNLPAGAEVGFILRFPKYALGFSNKMLDLTRHIDSVRKA